MRSCRRILICACLAFAWTTIPSPAQESVADTTELARLEETYARELKRIQSEMEALTARVQEQYIKALDAIARDFQARGNLDALLSVTEERKRYAETRVLNGENVSREVPELADRQNACLSDLRAVPMEEARRVISLVQLYDRSLGALQEKQTKEGRLQDAVKVRDARESLEGRAEVTSARFVLADAEAAQESESTTAEPLPEPAAPVAQSPAERKFDESDENRIRKRFQMLCDSMLDQDWEEATELVDPQFVEERGKALVHAHFSFALPFLRVTEQPQVKLGIEDVSVDDDGTHAVLIPKVWINSRWREQTATSWILVNGDWYLNMTQGATTVRPRPRLIPRRLRR